MTLVPALFFTLLEAGLRSCGYGYSPHFFLLTEIDGRPVYIDNPEFGRLFFPRGLARRSMPLVVPADKPRDCYRIFVLGESAAQGFPDNTFGFARILQVMLRDRYPQTRFEIVNAAVTAINSHVIVPIARDCAALQPDLFILYMGNNEVVGPFGAAGVLGPYTPSVGVIRAHAAAKSMRTGQLLADIGQWLAHGDAPATWDGLAMFRRSRLRADDPRRLTIYENFRRNLHDICVIGVSAGARVAVCTIAVNLRSCAPFASLHPADAVTERIADWNKLYEQGKQADAAGRHAEALPQYTEAAALDDGYADLRFRLARCQEGLGQLEAAGRYYRAARDVDALPLRADARINEAIQMIAGAWESKGVYLVNAEQAFDRASRYGVPGDDLFLEHVHMNFAGNYLLARTLFARLRDILPEGIRSQAANDAEPPSESACAEQLAFADWHHLEIAQQVAAMFHKPPFTDQLDREERDQRVRQRLEELRPRGTPESLQQAVTACEQAVAKTPDDWMLRANLGRLLNKSGECGRAAEQFRAVVKQLPHFANARSHLALALARCGDMKEAIVQAEEALRRTPDFASAPEHLILGDILFHDGRQEQALSHYSAAVQLNPNDRQAHDKLIRVLRALGRTNEAQAHENELRQKK